MKEARQPQRNPGTIRSLDRAAPDASRSPPERIVLIAGTGRSGTTWLGKLFDASPDVRYLHEPDNCDRVPWFRDIPSRIDPVPENDRFRDSFAIALEKACASHGTHFLQRPDFSKAFLRNVPWRIVNFALRAQRKLRLRDRTLFRVPRWMVRGDSADVHYVIKSVVSNFRLAWIRRHFPNIRIILLMRHPGGYLSSWIRGHERHGWLDFGRRERLDPSVLPFPLPEQHHKYAGGYENGTQFERELIYWIVANETPLAALGRCPALEVVVYEELCREPECVLERLFAFCGIEPAQRVRDFIRDSTSRHQTGFHDVYKDPKIVAEKWRSELSIEQQRTVERYLEGTLLQRYWPASSR